jgi:hypothetical protein
MINIYVAAMMGINNFRPQSVYYRFNLLRESKQRYLIQLIVRVGEKSKVRCPE